MLNYQYKPSTIYVIIITGIIITGIIITGKLTIKDGSDILICLQHADKQSLLTKSNQTWISCNELLMIKFKMITVTLYPFLHLHISTNNYNVKMQPNPAISGAK